MPSQATSYGTTPTKAAVTGWISFSMDGRFAYSSTGKIIDAATKKIVAALQDEIGRQVQSEKMLDLAIANGRVVRAGNQLGVGMKQVYSASGDGPDK